MAEISGRPFRDPIPAVAGKSVGEGYQIPL